MARINLNDKIKKAVGIVSPQPPSPAPQPAPSQPAPPATPTIEQPLPVAEEADNDAAVDAMLDATPGAVIVDQVRDELLAIVREIRLEAAKAAHPLISINTDGLRFSDDQRRELLTLLGTADPESVLRHVRNLVEFRAEDTTGTITLPLVFSAQQLERIASRCSTGDTLTSKLQEYCNYGVNLQTGLA